MGKGGAVGLAVYLVVLTILLFASLYWTWPECEPSPSLAANNSNLSVNANANANLTANGNGNRPANRNANRAADRNASSATDSNPNAPTNGNSNVRPEKTGDTNQPDGPSARGTKAISIAPKSGTIKGNTPVTITWEGIQEGAQVMFGGLSATNLNVNAASKTLSARTPTHEEGAVDVELRNPDGSNSTLSAGYTYRCPPLTGPHLLLLVILAGALGGTIHALRSLYWYVGNRDLVESWVPMYFTLPFSGAAVAVVFYLIIRGGLFTFSINKDISLVVVAIAAITGLFSQQAALKLRDIANAVLTKPGAGDDAHPQTSLPVGVGAPIGAAPAPTVTSIDPVHGTTSGGTPVTITGTNFTKGSIVNFGDKAATDIEFVDVTKIKAKTPKHEPGKVDLAVANADGKSGTLLQGYDYTS